MVSLDLKDRDLVLTCVAGVEGFGSPMDLVDQTPLLSRRLSIYTFSGLVNCRLILITLT